MDLDRFSNAVLKEVLDMIGRSFDIKMTEVQKNNGVVCPAISAVTPGEAGGPGIFPDRYFEDYRNNGMGIGEAAKDICRAIIEHGYDLRGTALSRIREWETVRHSIYAKLVNREMNKNSLADMPHRDFLDLAVVYYVEVDGITNEGVIASFMVKNGHMEAWGQDEESLYCTAFDNMRVRKQPLFEDMNKVMREMMQEEIPFADWEDIPESNTYILSNQKKVFGAAELLDGNILREIGEKLGSDYVVFPSSIHECVIMPSNDKLSYRELAGVVREINRTQVVMEERLSDHVYLYEREEGELKIAA